MNQQHYFQSQRTADEQHLGSSHSRRLDKTTNTKRAGIAARPSNDEVAKRAYLIYLNQGCPEGHDLEHWLAAEAQLVAA